MVSMKDIANRLSISRCTVSNIINNRLDGKSYRKETIDLVLQTAKEMGYVSNSMARALKTGQTGTIAIVVPDLSNTFYIKIIKEVERRANECGYSLIICMAEEILEKENAALTMLQSRCVDGVLISPVSYDNSLITSFPYRIVCFDRSVKDKNFCSVRIDNYNAGRQLTEAIIQDGAKRPLFVCGSKQDYTVVRRYNGLCDVLLENHCCLDENNLLANVYDETAAYDSVIQAIDSGIEFDSILLSTNYVIYGVLRALRERAHNTLSIGGFETFSGMEFCKGDFRLHVLEQPEQEMGRVAFEKLLALLKGETVESEILPTQIV